MPAGFGAFAFSTCPAGKVVLGGGYFFVNSADSQFVHVTQSLPAKPTFQFEAWLVIMDIPSGEHLIRVYAICANVT